MNIEEFKIKGLKGKFIVNESLDDKQYPSITIEYVDDKDLGNCDSRPAIRMEYDKENKQLKALVWADPNDCDNTYNIDLDKDYLKHIEED